MRSGLSIKAHLAILALIATLPILFFVSFLAIQILERDTKDFQEELREKVVLLSESVERRVNSVTEQLNVLASSPALRAGDFKTFHQYASDANKIMGGIGIVLVRPDGQQIVNSRIPYGELLPKRANLETQDRVFELKKPQVSNLIIAAASPEPIISIEVPVVVDGTVRYVLATGLSPRYIADVMQRQVPERWVAGIIDAKGVVISRVPWVADLVGKPVSQNIHSRIGEPAGHWIENVSGSGVANYSSFLRSENLGWTAAMGLPRDIVDGRLFEALLLLGTGGAIAITLSLMVAWLFGSRIARAFSQLEASILGLGNSPTNRAPSSNISEVQRMQSTLTTVGDGIEASRIQIESERSLLKATVEAMPIGVLLIAQAENNIFLTNHKLHELWGQSDIKNLNDLKKVQRFDLDGKPYDLERWPILRALRTGEVVRDEEVVHITPSGSRRRVVINAAPVLGPGDEIVAAVAALYDVTELRDALDSQKLLLDEVNHRVKNTMATIQSIVHLTRGASHSVDEFATGFQARLIALSGAYDLLTHHNWEGAGMIALLDRTLAPYRAMERVVTVGPDIQLSPKIALALTAAIQELATNAAKYGALSGREGVVSAKWEIIGEKLEFQWLERKGPKVSPPNRRGFGTRFIEEVLARDGDWDVDMFFEPEGVSCNIRIELGEHESQVLPHSRIKNKGD